MNTRPPQLGVLMRQLENIRPSKLKPDERGTLISYASLELGDLLSGSRSGDEDDEQLRANARKIIRRHRLSG